MPDNANFKPVIRRKLKVVPLKRRKLGVLPLAAVGVMITAGQASAIGSSGGSNPLPPVFKTQPSAPVWSLPQQLPNQGRVFESPNSTNQSLGNSTGGQGQGGAANPNASAAGAKKGQ